MKLQYWLYVATLVLPSANLAAAESPDFSGSYRLTKVRGGVSEPKKGTVWTLEVVQSATKIKVTRVRNGRKFSNTFSLDGTQGIYNDPSGITGKCRGHFKGRHLYLDSVVIVQPKGGLTIRAYSTESWELSADFKTLTIHTEVETTNADGRQILPNNVQPWAEVYTRN